MSGYWGESRVGYLSRLDREDWGPTINQLVWRYGAYQARRILLGVDSRSNLDVWRWRALGRRP